MNTNELSISKLEAAYEERAKTIFTDANIGPIVFYLNRLVPNIFPLVKENEFETVVSSARIDGMKLLISLVQESVLGAVNKQKKK